MEKREIRARLPACLRERRRGQAAAGEVLQFLQYPASSLVAGRNDAGHGILRKAGTQKRRMMLNRSSGTYLHPTPPQTIACSAFYEVTISAKPQHFEFPPHLNANTARYCRQSKPQELHLRNQKTCPNKRGHLFRLDDDRADLWALDSGSRTRCGTKGRENL